MYKLNFCNLGLRSRNQVRTVHSRCSLREHPDVATPECQGGVHVQGQGGVEGSKTHRSPQASKRVGLTLSS